MDTSRTLTDEELDGLLTQAREGRASASIREVGQVRIQGDLQVCGLEHRQAVHFMGARRRDQLPPPGRDVSISMLLGEEIYTLWTRCLEPIISMDGDTQFPPVIRVEWPATRVECHRRDRLRVAASDLPPLVARLGVGDTWIPASLLNLTESGLGLGLDETLILEPLTKVKVQTELPGGIPFEITGELRHLEQIVGDRFATRLGLVMETMSQSTRETLQRFIQARRTDRSVLLRSEN